MTTKKSGGKHPPGQPRGLKGRRLSEAEVLHRLEVIRVALLEERWTPNNRAKICNAFGVSERQLWRDKAKLQAEMLAEYDEDVRLHRMRLSNRMRHAYKLALDANELGHAIAATREEAHITGARAPRQLEVSHTGGVELTVTGAQAVAGDPLSHAREILDPRMQAWARAVLAQHGEAIPNVIETAPLLKSAADAHDLSD